MRPPVPEAMVYLVFKVQFREWFDYAHQPSKTKVPFQPSTCQYPIFHTALKPLSHIHFSLSVNRFLGLSASNPCSTYIIALKFNTSIFTPTHSRILNPKTNSNRSPLPQSPPNSTRNHSPNRPQTRTHDRTSHRRQLHRQPSPNSRNNRRQARTQNSTDDRP